MSNQKPETKRGKGKSKVERVPKIWAEVDPMDHKSWIKEVPWGTRAALMKKIFKELVKIIASPQGKLFMGLLIADQSLEQAFTACKAERDKIEITSLSEAIGANSPGPSTLGRIEPRPDETLL
jgi:hypothetical protein